MKKLFLIVFLLFATSAFAGDVWVDGYFRKDGTYVPGHYRTRPNKNIWDNYSTKGNINPYTGKKGYVDPYKNLYKPEPIRPITPYRPYRLDRGW